MLSGFGIRRYVGQDRVTYVTSICPARFRCPRNRIGQEGPLYRRKNRLSIFAILGKVPCIWPAPLCSLFAMAGALIPVVRKNGKKTATRRFLRERRFTTGSTGSIQAPN